MDEYTCSEAAYEGHLDCLEYARKQEPPCPWNEKTCSAAALNGHLDCLVYAHENSCPWDRETLSNALKYNHLDCLKYALNSGCPNDAMFELQRREISHKKIKEKIKSFNSLQAEYLRLQQICSNLKKKLSNQNNKLN